MFSTSIFAIARVAAKSLRLHLMRSTLTMLGIIIGVWAVITLVAIGEGASELVHIGQAVMAHGGLIDYFVDTVFNYPTLAECYKTAAFDGLNRVDA